jgi:hypothetical protein
MLSNDGNWELYRIVWRSETYFNGKWCGANLDNFWVDSPEYKQFTASGDTWQKTGVHGTFDPVVALKVRDQLNQKYGDKDFHVQKVEISQKRTVLDVQMERDILYDKYIKEHNS